MWCFDFLQKPSGPPSFFRRKATAIAAPPPAVSETGYPPVPSRSAIAQRQPSAHHVTPPRMYTAPGSQLQSSFSAAHQPHHEHQYPSDAHPHPRTQAPPTGRAAPTPATPVRGFRAQPSFAALPASAEAQQPHWAFSNSDATIPEEGYSDATVLRSNFARFQCGSSIDKQQNQGNPNLYSSDGNVGWVAGGAAQHLRSPCFITSN